MCILREQTIRTKSRFTFLRRYRFQRSLFPTQNYQYTLSLQTNNTTTTTTTTKSNIFFRYQKNNQSLTLLNLLSNSKSNKKTHKETQNRNVQTLSIHTHIVHTHCIRAHTYYIYTGVQIIIINRERESSHTPSSSYIREGRYYIP